MTKTSTNDLIKITKRDPKKTKKIQEQKKMGTFYEKKINTFRLGQAR
jgi:hypothetical protein